MNAGLSTSEDPRYLRSRDLLSNAIWALAAQKPVNKIGVAELCRVSSVTRDTFYRHANSPSDLLAGLVRGRIEAMAEENAREADLTPNPMIAGVRKLLAHIDAHASVYRLGLEVESGAPLFWVLVESLSTLLRAAIENEPGLLPHPLAADPVGPSIAVRYAASGAVGAIQVWLSSSDVDIDRAVSLIVAASPAFWIPGSLREPD